MITLVKLNLVHKKYINDINSLIRSTNRLKIIVKILIYYRIQKLQQLLKYFHMHA